MGLQEGEERGKGTEEIFQTMTENFPQINVRHQNRSRKLREHQVGSMPPKWHWDMSFSNYRKSKTKISERNQKKQIP